MPRDVLTVAHAMAGRLRLRLPDRAETAELVDTVRAISGVTACVWNPRTHGLLVRYQPEATTSAAIVAAVAEHAGVPLPDDDGNGDRHDQSVAETISAALSDLNTRVARATGGRLDLGVVVPLVLATWAVRQFFRGQVPPLSWSSALWYAHGLFRDYGLRDRS